MYVVTENMGRNTEPTVNERIVKSVGRLYVTPEGSWEEQFSCDYQSDDKYLLEKKDWREKKLLFQTRQDADNYLERVSLQRWMLGQSTRRIESLSLEQLRTIKMIVENPEITLEIQSVMNEKISEGQRWNKTNFNDKKEVSI